MPIIGLNQTVAPSVEPVTLAEAKAHLRVVQTLDNALLTALIVAARSWCEEYTRRQFITATWLLTLDRFPRGMADYVGGETSGVYGQDEDSRVIRLPRPNLLSVASVTYVSYDGSTVTLASNTYRVDTNSAPGRLSPAFGSYWPPTRLVTGAVTITYTGGYGAAASAVPEPIKDAMKVYIQRLYDPMNAPDIEAIKALLSPYRIEEYR